MWFRILVVILVGCLSVVDGAEAQSLKPLRLENLRRMGSLSPVQRDEVIWLARCMYSESDRGHEQRLVGWVVRNRVETGYRGATYRDVVLEPKQFSAFNKATPRRARILKLGPNSPSRPWQRTLSIALDVYKAPAIQRPFSSTTRHFYSPVSMPGHRAPHWAADATPLDAVRLGHDPHRFLFFAGIDEGLAETPQVLAAKPAARMDARPRARLSKRRFSGRVRRPARPSVRTARSQ